MAQNSTELVTCDVDVDVGKALKRPSRAKMTPAKRRQFLQVFADTFNFTKAAKTVGVHRVKIYELIETDPVFAAAFHDVKNAYLDTVEEASISVALQADARGFNDRKLMLQAHRREIYGQNPEINIALQINNLQAAGELHNLTSKIPIIEK